MHTFLKVCISLKTRKKLLFFSLLKKLYIWPRVKLLLVLQWTHRKKVNINISRRLKKKSLQDMIL